MLLNNNIIFVSNLTKLNLLLNNIYLSDFTPSFNTIAIKHYIEESNEIVDSSSNTQVNENINIIRIWKTKSVFDYFFSIFCYNNTNFIGAIDYSINDDNIRIEYLFINDNDDKNKFYDNILDENESIKLTKSLINYIKILAKEKNKNKIVVEVHNNLRLYKKYYMNEGFIINNDKSTSDPCWIETEFILNPIVK
jgi:hypothetical protein